MGSLSLQCPSGPRGSLLRGKTMPWVFRRPFRRVSCLPLYSLPPTTACMCSLHSDVPSVSSSPYRRGVESLASVLATTTARNSGHGDPPRPWRWKVSAVLWWTSRHGYGWHSRYPNCQSPVLSMHISTSGSIGGDRYSHNRWSRSAYHFWLLASLLCSAWNRFLSGPDESVSTHV